MSSQLFPACDRFDGKQVDVHSGKISSRSERHVSIKIFGDLGDGKRTLSPCASWSIPTRNTEIAASVPFREQTSNV